MEESKNNQEAGLEVVTPGHINTVIGSNANAIAKTILENIQRVKDDPKFIPQAEAINSQLKTLVDLGKSEIEMLKVSAFLSGGK